MIWLKQLKYDDKIFKIQELCTDLMLRAQEKRIKAINKFKRLLNEYVDSHQPDEYNTMEIDETGARFYDEYVNIDLDEPLTEVKEIFVDWPL